MPAFLAVACAVVASAMWGITEAPLGAALGYLLGLYLHQRSRIEKLEEVVSRLAELARGRELEPQPPPVKERASVREPDPPRAEPMGTHHAAPPPPIVEDSGPSDGPSWLDRLWLRTRPFLTGPSLIVTVGVVVLFFGCAFLLKFAVERGLVPIELRLSASALGGIALLAIGWRTRSSRPGFGLALQGGGVGVLYLTVFAAFRLYALLPGAAAFALLFVFVALSALLAVKQDALPLATLATAGGFLAPVLTSTGEGSHVALFSYYVLLNAGILTIAWFKSFRLLNLLGFLFTFVISASWGARYYRPEYFGSTEPFLVLFFLLYVAIAVVYALRQPPNLRGLVDGTLVFGVPLAAALFQSALVRDFEYGLAWSAVSVGAFYILLARALLHFRPEVTRALAEAFLGTGIVFATLAVPFAFEPLVTSAFWALEGAAIVWMGARQNRALPRFTGSALQLLAAGAFFSDPGSRGDLAVLNGRWLGAAIVALAAMASSLQLSRNRERIGELERALGSMFFGWGVLWWLGAGLSEIVEFTEADESVGWTLLFFTLTAALALFLGRRLRFTPLEKLSLGLLPSLALPLLFALGLRHPLEGLALPGWVVALAAHLAILRSIRESRVTALWHAAGIWVVSLLASWEVSYLVAQAIGSGTWAELAWGWVPNVLVLGLFYACVRVPWPFRAHREAYLHLGAAPVVLFLYVWTLFTNVASPWDPAPLPYLPVLSPVDVVVLLALATFLLWSVRMETPAGAHWLAAGSAFVWMHGVVARTAHFHAGVPFSSDALFASTLVQAAVSVLWSLVGLACMLLGTRNSLRPLWTAGAALMGAVVIKLFVVDLSHTGTVERIVSFIGVGVLLLVVGYASPVPPRRASIEGAAS